MKKIILVVLLFSFTLTLSAQDQISVRLKYQWSDGGIQITDFIDDKLLAIRANRAINDTYRLVNARTGEQIVTIDIYDEELTAFIASTL